MKTAAPSSATIRIAASAAALLIAGLAFLRAAPPVSAGNGTIIVGTFPKQY